MTLLLLADPALWAAKVATEAGALGIAAPPPLTDAGDALLRLAGSTPVSHLLVQPDSLGCLRDSLIEMTAGAVDCPARLIVLGDPGNIFAIPGAIHADDAPGWLGRAMGVPAPPDDPVGLDDAELLDALAAGGLRASYQPIVRVGNGQAVGLEALARLRHPQRGMLAPALFVPHAEASGLGWMLFRLLTAIVLRDWNAQAMARLGLPVGLNIAVDDILRPDLPGWLSAQCAAAAMPPSMLVLEMTETQPVQDAAALRMAVGRLGALGFTVMIDDVGPGLRDPAGLLDLDFTGMKIDRLLVNAAVGDTDARRLLTRLLGHARQAGLATVAEGVEDAATWDHVRALGFDLVQGFLASRPLPAAAVATWHLAWTGSGR